MRHSHGVWVNSHISVSLQKWVGDEKRGLNLGLGFVGDRFSKDGLVLHFYYLVLI